MTILWPERLLALIPPERRPHFIDVPPHRDPSTVACRMRRATRPGFFVRSACGVWSFCLSHDAWGWLFTAKYAGAMPSHQNADLETLARVLLGVGGEGAPEPESLEKDPTSVHRWHWPDPGASEETQRAADNGMVIGALQVALSKRQGTDGLAKISHEEFLQAMRKLRGKNGHTDCDCEECVVSRETMWCKLVEDARAHNPQAPLQ